MSLLLCLNNRHASSLVLPHKHGKRSLTLKTQQTNRENSSRLYSMSMHCSLVAVLVDLRLDLGIRCLSFWLQFDWGFLILISRFNLCLNNGKTARFCCQDALNADIWRSFRGLSENWNACSGPERGPTSPDTNNTKRGLIGQTILLHWGFKNFPHWS